MYDGDLSIESDPLRRRLRRLSAGERREEALAFLELFHRETGKTPAQLSARRREVERELRVRGVYDHTAEELAFGAKVAWRNSARCIGRRVWRSLDVVDCRAVRDPDEVAARIFEHLETALAAGPVRSTVTIFAPLTPGGDPVYVENQQVVQFAGYLAPGREVVGDPQNVEFTRIAMGLGWSAPARPGPFDVLPLMIRRADGRRRLYEIPHRLHRLVEIRHAAFPRLAALGLKWTPVPVVSDMILTIGGVDYPCAPFNGYFMSTEIASRDLVDEVRYDLLPAVADAFGMDRADPFWKDRATVELNAAVLASFRAAGVTMVDHHAASDQFLDFVQAERADGRQPSSDWAWIVPPTGGASCPVFHLAMSDLADVPNFYRSRATDGAGLGVSRATERQGRLVRLARRLQRWSRARRRARFH